MLLKLLYGEKEKKEESQTEFQARSGYVISGFPNMRSLLIIRTAQRCCLKNRFFPLINVIHIFSSFKTILILEISYLKKLNHIFALALYEPFNTAISVIKSIFKQEYFMLFENRFCICRHHGLILASLL